VPRPGRRPGEQTKADTRIAEWRVKRGLTQQEAADAVGLSLNGYWKYERGHIDNPGIRQLANLAIVFGCELEDLIEDDWRRGTWGMGKPRRPEDPSSFWRTDRGAT